jgi:hypothetical protein
MLATFRPAARLAGALLLASAGLAACRMIDQRTFEHAPAAPSGQAQGGAPLPALPLVTIDFSYGGGDWQTSVDEAVRMAQARKPEVAFDVVGPIPVTAGRDKQDKVRDDELPLLRQVADRLQTDGIPPARITLGLRGDRGAPPLGVLIYVR